MGGLKLIGSHYSPVLSLHVVVEEGMRLLELKMFLDTHMNGHYLGNLEVMSVIEE